MVIEPKFKIKDRVWVIRGQNIAWELHCPDCGGSGQIEKDLNKVDARIAHKMENPDITYRHNTANIKCKHCEGEGVITVVGKLYHIESVVIDSIDCHIGPNGQDIMYHPYYNGIDDTESSVSGTENEANKKCEVLNAEFKNSVLDEMQKTQVNCGQ